ncbi:hypothetical protein [Ochrobactrum quorumnocens]|uniref:Uncharacterized protein n=1 Tax=Ochrobactrum quorumnocens TaxID=271865 RepID=A0A5N1JSK9_9HYPH|nr:hypothetical protein [[Ochrobactrum] quorumnocens]KAA9366149.1 hypothetical protein F3W84_18010 [[Ochrobactrum] quorumnocens]
MMLYLNESKARVHFKYMMGNANQLIITLLVGLEAVDRRLITEIPEDLHAAWSPRDREISAKRSRRLLLDMALARAVDSLDVYIRRSRRRPELIQDKELQSEIDGAGRSVARKFKAITSHYSHLPKITVAMIALMIAWRNRAVHEEADTEIHADHQAVLEGAQAEISEKYRGLDVEMMMGGFKNSAPTFKEIASLIHATGDFIRDLEGVQFRSLNTEQYLKGLILEDIQSTQITQSARQAEMKQRLQSLWGKDKRERPSVVSRFLHHRGLTPEAKYDYSLVFSDKLLGEVFEMRPSEIWEWLFGSTSIVS